jgi:hypothetical protein
VWKRDQLTEPVGRGVEGDAEQYAGKDQEQRGGEIPGEQQERSEQYGTNSADGDGPGQIIAGLQPFVSRICHVESSFHEKALNTLSTKAAGIKRAGRAGLTLPAAPG